MRKYQCIRNDRYIPGANAAAQLCTPIPGNECGRGPTSWPGCPPAVLGEQLGSEKCGLPLHYSTGGGFGLATFMRCMITSRTIDRMQRQNLLRQKRKSRDQCKTATPTWSQGLSHNGFEQKCNSQFVASGTNGAGDEAAKLFSATRLFHS